MTLPLFNNCRIQQCNKLSEEAFVAPTVKLQQCNKFSEEAFAAPTVQQWNSQLNNKRKKDAAITETLSEEAFVAPIIKQL